ncbi:HD-GYP domain-containing protein [Clostridium sp. HMP27]|uniref:HD-GYP domain-containing protein n=1 Tax=Clostridium sp. HMP27 TaxID=1487921 RepID=UPI00052C2F0E|nr:HD-GYP domain-containing protein [Clostridium sp. HMP27]KGK89576.1 HD family phosphohydrolase [Clostridium sp. HMP27]
MRLEFINRVKEQEVLGKSILSSDGKILLRAGMKLTDSYIKKLRELGVFYIYVEDERLDDVQVEDEHLSELKQITMKTMGSLIRNVNNVNKKELKECLNVVENLIEYIIDLGDVNKSLNDIKTFDNYTYVHSLDTCIMTSFLGLSSGFNEASLKDLGIGAILHDIGKTKIPSKILNKEGKLTDEEFREIKKHPVYGAEILKKNISISDSIVHMVEQHHERVDGKGYPYGLSGNGISKSAKIICICDVYDAISNDRCYRRKFSPNDSYELILSGAGTSFDMSVVQKFKDTFAIYPLGCRVRISNGEEGYVIRQNKGFPDRPVLRMFYDAEQKSPIPFYEIDLLKNPSLVVEMVI